MALLAGLQGVDLTTVNTKYPCIATAVYVFKIETAVVKQSKSGTSMLVMECTTLADALDVDGKHVPAGYKLTHNITIEPTGKRTVEQCAADVAKLQEAVFGHRIPVDQFDTDMLIGGTFTAKTKTEESDEYGTQPRIAKFIPKDGSAAHEG